MDTSWYSTKNKETCIKSYIYCIAIYKRTRSFKSKFIDMDIFYCSIWICVYFFVLYFHSFLLYYYYTICHGNHIVCLFSSIYIYLYCKPFDYLQKTNWYRCFWNNNVIANFCYNMPYYVLLNTLYSYYI